MFARALVATFALSSPLLLPVAADAAPQTYQFFAGTTETRSPEGKVLGTADALVERVLDPDRGTITERVLAPSRRTPGKHDEFLVTFKIATDGTLTMSEHHGMFSGTGRVQGAPWQWSDWHTVSTVAGGMKVTSDDHLEGGQLTAKKQVFGPDGKAVATISETYHAVDAASFELTYYAWMLQ